MSTASTDLEPAWPLHARFRLLTLEPIADVHDAHGRLYCVLRGRSAITAFADPGERRALFTARDEGDDDGYLRVSLHGALGLGGVLLLQRAVHRVEGKRHFVDASGTYHRIEAARGAASYTARRSNGVPLLKLVRRNWTLRRSFRIEAPEQGTPEERALLLPALLVLMMVARTFDPSVPPTSA